MKSKKTKNKIMGISTVGIGRAPPKTIKCDICKKKTDAVSIIKGKKVCDNCYEKVKKK